MEKNKKQNEESKEQKPEEENKQTKEKVKEAKPHKEKTENDLKSLSEAINYYLLGVN